MSFNNFINFVHVIFGLSQNCEVMVTWEMSTFDLKLIEMVMVSDMFSPNFLDMGVI